MDIENLKDITCFGKLENYLINDPKTSALIEVTDERLDLVEVAECFVDGSPLSLFNVRSWQETGAIKFNTVKPRYLAVEVIQIVPFFIFKSLNKRYE